MKRGYFRKDLNAEWLEYLSKVENTLIKLKEKKEKCN